MRAFPVLLLAIPVLTAGAQSQGFGVCKPVAQRTAELGCWILTDQSVGRATGADVYWHLDAYPDSAQARHARGPRDVVVKALGKTWVMSIDTARTGSKAAGQHITDIGPLRVKPGTEYSATFMEAVMTPGMTSAVHRHSGPEAWYTVAGETCLETPNGKVTSHSGQPAIVPQGSPMFLTAIGSAQRRGITLILHEASQPPTTMEHTWKPKGLCK